MEMEPMQDHMLAVFFQEIKGEWAEKSWRHQETIHGLEQESIP